MEYTGAQILIESLITHGAEVIFGYPGGAVLDIYDALYAARDRLTHITASHEQGAVHAADGYARSTGKTGIVLATSGPGATNLVTGLAAAYYDSVPLVAITGNVTNDLLGRDSFQEIDIISITNPIVKHNYFVQDVNGLQRIVREAFEIAHSGRKGPVLIDIPKDVATAKAAYTPTERFTPRPMPEPDAEGLGQALRLLADCQRPLIYCGGGVVFSDSAGALAAFAEKLDAPVCVSMMGLTALPSRSERCLGLVGMHGTAYANMAVGECDLLIAVGARFSDRAAGYRKGFAGGARVIHIDIDRTEISKNVQVDFSLVGDAGVCLRRLTAQMTPQNHVGWMRKLSRAKTRRMPPAAASGSRADPRTVIDTLGRLLPPDALVVTDVGQHQMLVAQHFPFTRPRSFLSSCGLGAMGYGMGAANGAAIGNPGQPVALVTGDGSFHMNTAELAVAVSHDLPILALVMNNGALGMVRQWQKLFYGGRYSCTEIARKTDFKALGVAFGAKGFRIGTREEIGPVLREALSVKGPCVIDCLIDPEDCVFPIIPPGGKQEDMICEMR